MAWRTRTRLVTLAFMVLVVAVVAGALWYAQRNPALRARALDTWLTTKIMAQYATDADVPARRVSVRTVDRVVTLSGPMAVPEAREQALAIARTTDGVTAVIDRLWVEGETATEPTTGAAAATEGPAPVTEASPAVTEAPAGATATPAVVTDVPPTGSDEWIVTTIRAQFYADESIRAATINVAATDGVVRLAGQVPTEGARQNAIAIATATQGVREVEASALSVKPEPPLTSLAPSTDGAAIADETGTIVGESDAKKPGATRPTVPPR